MCLIIWGVYLFLPIVINFSFQCGVIECVPDAKSRDQIGRKANTSLYTYFQKVILFISVTWKLACPVDVTDFAEPVFFWCKIT